MNNSVHQLNVFVDNNGLLRYVWKINNANVPYDAKFPYLIPKNHYFTKLVVIYAHSVVLHSDVRETLNFIRSQYWKIQGRNFVKKIIHECSTCKYYEGKPYSYPEKPPSPKQRLSKDHVFSCIGINYTDPIYLKSVYASDATLICIKSWIVKVASLSIQALYLDVVKILRCCGSSASCVNMLKQLHAFFL